VLATLAGAKGRPMTAGEVASSTGLGRASVSTTLSKLARSGEVNKAARGYQLVADGGRPASSGPAASSSTPTGGSS
jgi:DNA-binding IclR family transcriptional regulator